MTFIFNSLFFMEHIASIHVLRLYAFSLFRLYLPSPSLLIFLAPLQYLLRATACAV